MSTIKKALQEAVDAAGGQTALAKLCGGRVKQGHVYYWLKVGRLPAIHAPAIENGTGVSRHRLCPDFPWDDQEDEQERMRNAV